MALMAHLSPRSIPTCSGGSAATVREAIDAGSVAAVSNQRAARTRGRRKAGHAGAGSSARIMDGFLTLVLDERTTADLRAIDYTVTLVDGRAVPRWLERTSFNILQGSVPVGQTALDLRVRGAYPDGKNTVAELQIDLNTSVVARSQPLRRDYLALLFGEQIRRFAYLSAPGADAIAGALGAVTADRNES